MERNCSHAESFSPSALDNGATSQLPGELSLRCSLDADASGASDERPRGSHQLHHCGDVRQHGEPLVCGTSVSRFDPGTSHD